MSVEPGIANDPIASSSASRLRAELRHIGDALLQAHKAVTGDISGVTSGLGIAFNATFVALLLTLILMFFLHQLQQAQEQFVHDTDHWIDQHLIRHMQVR